MGKDRRTYVKFHNGAPDHPKVRELSDGAFRSWVRAMCWCSVNKTNGLVPPRTMKELASGRRLAELLQPPPPPYEEPLVTLRPDGMYEVHDYLKHQLSVAEIEHARSVRAANGALGGRPPKPRENQDGNLAGSDLLTETEPEAEPGYEPKKKQMSDKSFSPQPPAVENGFPNQRPTSSSIADLPQFAAGGDPF